MNAQKEDSIRMWGYNRPTPETFSVINHNKSFKKINVIFFTSIWKLEVNVDFFNTEGARKGKVKLIIEE